MNTKILSITENTAKSGMGHYMRQAALKNYLLKQSIDLCIMRDPDISLNIKAGDLNKQLVLVDLSEERQLQLDLAALDFKYKICFDWSASDFPDVNIIVSEWADKEYNYKLQKYSGIEYFVINEDVFSASTYKKDYCLITVGAYLDEKILTAILKRLKTFYFKEIILIESGSVINLSLGKKLSDNLSRAAYLKYLAEAGLVLTNGGTTLVESLLLKKEIISVPKSKQEFSFAKSLESRKIPFGIWDVVGSYEEIPVLNPRSHKLDGLGVQRVGDMIRNLIVS